MRVQQLTVSETGQRVRRGEVLANLYSPEVLRADQEYLTARGWDVKASAAVAPSALGSNVVGHHGDASVGTGAQGSMAADARRRLELLGIAAPEIDAMAARGKPGDSVPIRSPSDGFHVTARNVVPGAAIRGGAPLFEVADLSKVWFLADVFEQDTARACASARRRASSSSRIRASASPVAFSSSIRRSTLPRERCVSV